MWNRQKQLKCELFEYIQPFSMPRVTSDRLGLLNINISILTKAGEPSQNINIYEAIAAFIPFKVRPFS